MTGPSDQPVPSRSSGSDWDRAERVASDLIRERGRGDDTMRLLVALGVAALLLVAEVVTALVLPERGTPQPVHRIAVLTVMGAAFVGSVGWLVWAVATGRFIVRWRGISSALSSSDRRALWRQVRGSEPSDEQHPMVSIAFAVQVRTHVVAVAPFFAGIAVFFGSQVLLQRSETSWLSLIVLGLYAAMVAVMLTQYRLATRFLARRR